MQFLESLLSETSLETDEKFYHELGFSYTRAELTQEIAKETEVGRRFVQALVEASAQEDVPLESFLLEDRS